MIGTLLSLPYFLSAFFIVHQSRSYWIVDTTVSLSFCNFFLRHSLCSFTLNSQSHLYHFCSIFVCVVSLVKHKFCVPLSPHFKSCLSFMTVSLNGNLQRHLQREGRERGTHNDILGEDDMDLDQRKGQWNIRQTDMNLRRQNKTCVMGRGNKEEKKS